MKETEAKLLVLDLGTGAHEKGDNECINTVEDIQEKCEMFEENLFILKYKIKRSCCIDTFSSSLDF